MEAAVRIMAVLVLAGCASTPCEKECREQSSVKWAEVEALKQFMGNTK